MARLRNHKKILKAYLQANNWQEHLEEIKQMPPREAIGPLLSFLLLGGDMTHRAAYALGFSVEKLNQEKTEDARNIIRRFMWHMNEESGNIGWGIPEAFAESLVQSERMAKDFCPVLLSYIMDTGRDDNYCDHDILRRSCYWAVGRFASARPELCVRVIPWLLKGLHDEDIQCRGLAAWALSRFKAGMVSPLDAVPMLRKLAASDASVLMTTCDIFDNFVITSHSVGELVQMCLKKVEI